MYYFLDKNYTEDEKKKVTLDKKYIKYSEEYDVFVDEKEQIIDIKGKKIVPITSSERLESIIKLIFLNGGIPINSLENIEAIRNWSSYVEPNYFRKTFRASELDDALMCYLIENIGLENEVCFKNLSSGYEKNILLKELIDNDSALRKTMDIYDKDLYSIEQIPNMSNNKQYRFFVVGRKIINASKQNNENYHIVEIKVIEETKKIVRSITFDFPNTFVIDVALINSKVELLNIEPFETAKRYLYNSIFPGEEDIEVTKVNRMPKEKRNKSYIYLEDKKTKEPMNDYFSKTYQEYIRCIKEEEKITLKYERRD